MPVPEVVGLLRGEGQLGGAHLLQAAGEPQPVQSDRGLEAAAQGHPHPGVGPLHQVLEAVEHLAGAHLVHVVEDQDDAGHLVAEHPDEVGDEGGVGRAGGGVQAG